MDLVSEAGIEVMLENPKVERDPLPGKFMGWCKFGDSTYIVLKREDGNESYVAERVIKAIHIIEPLGPSGA